jgi:hypothetical protein
MVHSLLNQTASPKDLTYRDETVFTTWEISFAAINKTLPGAADLLLVCSFFANNDLWEELFRPGIVPSEMVGQQFYYEFCLILSFIILSLTNQGPRYKSY